MMAGWLIFRRPALASYVPGLWDRQEENVTVEFPTQKDQPTLAGYIAHEKPFGQSLGDVVI